ncbi:MAG: hypothetical protein LBL65_05585 [Campylobacteraceae bacterium]|jgi:hypothetical protein|nr:hypothetical protein [Campylobacteraceae bacterium]
MYIREIDLINDVKAKLNTPDKRSYELFVSERNFPRAGEYVATIVLRVLPETNIEALSKELMKLFIQGEEVKLVRSYLTIIPEKQLRTVDFELQAIICLE